MRSNVSVSAFDRKLEEYADKLTYEEYVLIVMLRIQKNDSIILSMWNEGDVRFVETVDPLFPGDAYLCIITPDDKWDEVRAEETYPGYEYYIDWNYQLNKVHILHEFYWEVDLFHTPPALWDKKKMMDRELRPLDFATRDERIKKPEIPTKEYLLAEKMVSDYDLCKSNSDLEWYFFKNKYSYCNPLIIMGIDLYRGREREQRIIAELVKIACAAESVVIFQLWDTDAGFETLKNELSEYESKGCIMYERSRYNENFSGEDVDD